jgi:hypothetical protein
LLNTDNNNFFIVFLPNKSYLCTGLGSDLLQKYNFKRKGI